MLLDGLNLKMRAHLNADAIFTAISKDFAMVPDHQTGM
jgi:hypothetical protein